MTRRRFTLTEEATFRSRDGDEIKITDLTLEVTERSVAGGLQGGLFSSTTTTEEEGKEKREREKEEPGSPTRQVWDHYVAVFNATRQTLNPQRRRTIGQALKVRTLDECKRAIDGLRVSPHHNGENEQRQTYLDIRYALKGNGARGESPEERIDKMVALAPLGDDSRDHGLTSHQVRTLVDRVRYTAQSGGEKERGNAAYRALTDAGYSVRREGDRVWIEGA